MMDPSAGASISFGMIMGLDLTEDSTFRCSSATPDLIDLSA
jgi:hypothetical protein